MCGSSSASNWRAESGRSIATKRRFGMCLKTSNAQRRTSNSQFNPNGNKSDRYSLLLTSLFFVVMLAFKFCIHMRASAHHSWRHGRHMDVIARQLGPKRVGQTGERKFACAVGRHMRHGNLATDGRNIDDASPTPDAHFR